eukprot:1762477-Pleurochrysis_carterae.AAC.3
MGMVPVLCRAPVESAFTFIESTGRHSSNDVATQHLAHVKRSGEGGRDEVLKDGTIADEVGVERGHVSARTRRPLHCVPLHSCEAILALEKLVGGVQQPTPRPASELRRANLAHPALDRQHGADFESVRGRRAHCLASLVVAGQTDVVHNRARLVALVAGESRPLLHDLVRSAEAGLLPVAPVVAFDRTYKHMSREGPTCELSMGTRSNGHTRADPVTYRLAQSARAE